MTSKDPHTPVVEISEDITAPEPPATVINDNRAEKGGVKGDPFELLQVVNGYHISFTLEEEKKVLRKIDRRLLPIMLGAYFLQQLDKSSLSYTSVFNIQEDAGLKGTEYSWLGSILYVAQLVMQPLGALVLVKLPLGKVIAVAIFFWGVSLMGMTGSKNFGSLLATRFLLGSFESLIGPSLVAITTTWYRRSEQTNRVSCWIAMNGVTAILGSLSTYGLGHVRSETLKSYQIIFLYCGCLSLAFSVIALIWMPDSPMEANFLNEGEKLIAIERLRANQMGIVNRKWRWDHTLEAVLDLKTWGWFILSLSIAVPSGGISTFGPLIIKSFGFDQFKTILFNMPFGAVQIVVIFASGWASNKIGKGLLIAMLAVPCIIGAVIILEVPRDVDNRGVLLFAYYLISCNGAVTPLVYSWSSQNCAGDTKRKVNTAFVFIGMCAGNIIGPLLYNVDQAPRYKNGLISSLIMFCALVLISGLIVLYLMILNKKHGNMRERVGKSAVVIDQSMIGKTKVQDVAPDGKGEPITSETGDNGLNDMTDLKNEDFIYTY